MIRFGKQEIFTMEAVQVTQVKKYQTYNMYGDKSGEVEGELIRTEGSVKPINRNLKLRLADIKIEGMTRSYYISV